jgi:hypothetical protein
MIATLPAVDAGIEPLRTIAEARRPHNYPSRVAFRAAEGADYFASPLAVASFFTGPSDYEMPSDELYCPCGATIHWPDGNLGTAVELVEEHVGEAHPEATAKARAKRRREARS